MPQDPLHTTKVLFLVMGLTSGLLRVAPANAQAVLLDHDSAIVDSRFGYALAMDSAGQTAVVGSAQASIDADLRDATGVVYVFERSGYDWQRKQLPSGREVDMTDAFGAALSLSANGSVAIVGALMDGRGGLASGAAYVYGRQGLEYAQRTRLTAPAPEPGAWFGSEVVLNGPGTRGFVAARGEKNHAGGVYVVETRDGDWHVTTRLEAGQAAPFTAFGHSVSTDWAGETVIIGAPGYDYARGAAYVFVQTDSGWRESAHIEPEETNSGGLFGYAVAIGTNGKRMAVGSVANDDGGRDAGAVFVYTRAGDSWVLEGKIASPAGPDAWFGCSLAMGRGDEILIVGARADGRNAVLGGAAYLYRRIGSSWIALADLRKPDYMRADQFGKAIAIDAGAKWALIGAPGDPRIEFESGSAWMFDLSSIVTAREVAKWRRGGHIDIDAYPTPTAAKASIRVLALPREPIRLDVFDVLGRNVGRIFHGEMPADGSLALDWNPGGLVSGRYLLRVSDSHASKTISIVLQR